MNYSSTLSNTSLLPEVDLDHLLPPLVQTNILSHLYLQNEDQQGPEHMELFEALLREKDYERLPAEINCQKYLPEAKESTCRATNGVKPDLNDIANLTHHQKEKKISKARKASEGAVRRKEGETKPRKGSLKPRTCFPAKPKQTVGIQQNICTTCSFQNQQITQRLFCPLMHNEETDETSLFPSQTKIEQMNNHSQTPSEFAIDFESYLTLN